MVTRKTVKKSSKKKTTAKKTGKKKTVARKTAEKKAVMKKGSKYACRHCGLVVAVNTVCGCVDFCDIICCGEQMKPTT